jgi:hypothetical protein
MTTSADTSQQAARWCWMVAALAGDALVFPAANGQCRRFHKATDAEQVEALLALMFDAPTGRQMAPLRVAAGIGSTVETDTLKKGAD